MSPPVRYDERPEIGPDVLDAELGVREARSLGFMDVLGRTRAAFGLRPLTAPALLFVPLGALLGPVGLGWLSLEILGYLYPVIAVALACLGIFVGLGLDVRDAENRRLLAAASLEATVTIAVVAGAFGFLLLQWGVTVDIALVPLALVFGVCASATSASVVHDDDPPLLRTASRIADLDDVLPIVLGGVVLAVYAAATPIEIGQLLLLNVLAPLAVAAAGWFLFEHTEDEAERTVFVIGVIALLGGASLYLAVSPLLAGMMAGLFWRYAPGHADALIRDDLRRVQHPLVVLLLIFAGAAIQTTQLALWLTGPYILTRLTGKLLGGWLLWRVTPSISPGDLGSYLLPPGVIGLAFALSFHLASLSSVSAAALTAVTLGTLGSELVAALALLGPRRG